MKHLLLAYIYCNLGGVTSVWKQRMPALRHRGWLVDAIFWADYGGAFDLRASGVTEVSVAGGELASTVVRAVKTNKYDVVALVDTPELIGPVRDSFAGKLIYEIHVSASRRLQENAPRQLNKCDRILVPSAWSKSWVLAHFPELDQSLVEVCPNIVSEKDFHPSATDHPIKAPPELLWVGKLDALKNWREATRISGIVANERNVRLTMITGGLADPDRTKELLAEWMADGVSDHARWLHNLPLATMPNVYRDAASSGGLLLSTSISESFGLVVHEALRCGLPVVATRVGACPEIVQHEVSGLLYDPGDHAMAASYADRLLTDQDLRNRLTEGAAAALAGFDSTELARRYLDLLEGNARR